uniref:Uncharacterized protein n=1 Tax=Schlesneria paludicola TaxID=360056 RepID=A0A7C4LQS5_9PLAN
MDEVAQRFLEWLIKFGAVSLLLLSAAHLVGRRLRGRQLSSRKPPPESTGVSPPSPTPKN